MAEAAGTVADARKSREEGDWGMGTPSGPEPEDEPLELPPLAEPFAAGTPLAPVRPKYATPERGKRTYGPWLPMPGSDASLDTDWPRAEVLWLVKRLERSEYERGQLKAENRRLLRRLRKLRHKRGKR